MASSSKQRPGRTLGVLAGVVVLLFGLVALGGEWSPRLGLDLQGGTRIILQATSEGEDPTEDQLTEARDIIGQRVNGQGVSSSEVAVRGDRQIVVEIPGDERSDIVEEVGRTAQLRFRLVWGQASGAPLPEQPEQPEQPQQPGGGQGGGEGQDGGQGEGGGQGGGQGEGTGDGTGQGGGQQDGQGANDRNRVLAPWMLATSGQGGDSPGDGQSAEGPTAEGQGGGGSGGTGGGGGDQPTQEPTEPPADPPAQPDQQTLDQITLEDSIQLALSAATTGTGQPPPAYSEDFAALQQELNAFTCPEDPTDAATVDDTPGDPLVTCDDQGQKYLLSPTVIEGTQLEDAFADVPEVQWVVNLELDGDASEVFGDVTRALAGSQSQFAIVLDGQVLSAPTVNDPITNGQAQISGNFDQESANDLANSLKYGALPLEFDTDAVDIIGPSLAGSSLAAGVLAGLIGLALTIVYVVLYYRALGLVVVASIALAGLVTYELVVLLGASVGFTLTLPGIAGLIVGIGVTADSFIIYFERIRDEVREGKSLRLAAEAGWRRARTTIIAADAVQFLAAIVLYAFAIDEIRGFAFGLLMSTIVDIFIVFMFSKPLVTYLVRTRFFGRGHRLSGLDTSHLGITGREVTQVARTPRRPVGGTAS